MNKVEELIKKAETLASDRHNFESKWQDVADVMRPIKSNITIDRSVGDKDHIDKLFDSYPINAVATLKSIVIGVFFNRSIKPFALVSPKEEVQEDKAAAEWRSDFTAMMLKTMFDPKSGFTTALSEAVADYITFGTPGTWIEKGEKFPIKYNTKNIKDFLLAENKDGDADYVILTMKMEARQIMQKFGALDEVGEANIHEDIKKAADKEPFKKFDIQLHIYPRPKRDEEKIDPLNKPIEGVWVDVKHKLEIQETGWDTMPFAIGRSEKSSNEVYGTSRGMMALATVNQSNEMWRQLNEATEKALNPPLNVNANYNERLNLRAGATNYPTGKALAAGTQAVEQIVTVGSIAAGKDLIMLLREVVDFLFFLDKLKVLDDPRATLGQVMELRAESFRIMGDFIDGLVGYVDQVLDRTFNLLFNQIYVNNELIEGNPLFDKPLPDILIKNPDLKVEYINPITQSQRIGELTALDKLLADIANMAEFSPQALDLVDIDKAIRKKADILHVDPEILFSNAKVQQVRKDREAQQVQQEQMNQEQQAVDTAATAKQAEIT